MFFYYYNNFAVNEKSAFWYVILTVEPLKNVFLCYVILWSSINFFLWNYDFILLELK